MKNILLVMFALLSGMLFLQDASAKDRALRKQELPVVEGHPTVPQVPSTLNEVTTPIHLTRPEVLVDNATTTPLKYDSVNTGMRYVKNPLLDAELEAAKKAAAEKKAKKIAKYNKNADKNYSGEDLLDLDNN